MKNWTAGLFLLAAALLSSGAALAQSIGGNASLAVTTSTGIVAFPVNRQTWPSALIAPAAGSSQEVFYKLGDGTVTAATTDNALPSGGICVNVGPNTNIAAITASSTATLRITQLTTCALFSGGSGGGGGGGGSVTQGTVPWVVGQAVGTNLHMVCDSGCSSSTAPADETAFTAGTTPQSPVGGFFQTTATTNALTNGQMGAFQVTATRALFSNLRNAAGAEVGVAAVPLQVSLANTGANAAAVLVTGTAGTFPVTGTVTANAGTNLNTSALALETGGNLAQVVTDFGAPGAIACATDTASCSLNQQMQRLAQRLTTINTTLGTPFQAGGSIGNTTFAVTNTGTFAVQAALNAETTKVIGTIRVTGNVGGVLDAIGQNVTAPANWLQAGCQFNTSPTTISSGSGSPLQCATGGRLLVDIGATAQGVAQGSTTSGQTGSMIMGAVTTGDPAYTTAQTAYASLDVKGHQRVVLGGGVPETISATGTTAATTATLATGASTTTYICGFSIRANATAAATGNATVTGTITGTLNFTQWTAPNATGVGVTEEILTPCIPASAANTTIAVVSAAPGTGGVVSVTAWGYQQ